MQYNTLGRTGIKISNVCLGTMTWGQQNTQDEGFEQLDYALSRGVNFIDTAEMYAIPPKPETRGTTEIIIGNWIAARKNRDHIVLATKCAGRSPDGNWYRNDGQPSRHTAEQIEFALTRSLKSLQTDYVDLYQLHWPDREYRGFGFHSFRETGREETPIEAILEALSKQVEKGRIRAIGLSNESPWGLMKFLSLAEKYNLPRVASMQNVYSLVSRRYDYGLAEISMREDVGLLAYSPLAQGYLTGKYQNGAMPENTRKTLFGRLGRYEGVGAEEALNAALEMAQDHGISPVELALKFCDSRPFCASTIIGATTMDQLKANIDAFDVPWTDELNKAVHKFHERYRSPCP